MSRRQRFTCPTDPLHKPLQELGTRIAPTVLKDICSMILPLSSVLSEREDMLDIRGSVAVITGGAQGIGRALGEYWVAGGGKVVLADVSKERLEEAKK